MMDGFLEFHNKNHKEQQIHIIYDDKTKRGKAGICNEYENPDDLYTYCMRCDVINDKGEISEIGGIAEFDIKKAKYIDLGNLCSNKDPFDTRYTHDGAATILLNILKKYVKYKKKENPLFYLVLLASDDSKEYYLRQQLQTDDNCYFTYGENPKTLRKNLTPTQKELLLLRGDDGTLPTDFFKKERKRSKRIHPKKKYDYTLQLFIDKKDYETSLGESEDDTTSEDVVERDGNSFFECILL